ncbi:MAG: hypothetical protein ACM3ML_27820 [Micromonosporaceae bacterium]
MVITTVPRRVAKLEYSAVRLPFWLLEKHVVARYLDDEAALRLGFERLVGSLDTVAGWLLADDAISRRGQALRRRTAFLAKAGKLDTKAQARRAQAEENLHAEQEAARQTREQARREADDKVVAAFHREQEEKQELRRRADARATTEKAQARRAADNRAAKAEEAKQATQRRISAQEERATAGPKQQLSDAAGKHRSAEQRRQEADRLDRLARGERNSRRSG